MAGPSIPDATTTTDYLRSLPLPSGQHMDISYAGNRIENIPMAGNLVHEQVGLEIKGAAAEGRSGGEPAWEGGRGQGGDEQKGGDRGGEGGEGGGDDFGGGGEEDDEEQAGHTRHPD